MQSRRIIINNSDVLEVSVEVVLIINVAHILESHLCRTRAQCAARNGDRSRDVFETSDGMPLINEQGADSDRYSFMPDKVTRSIEEY